MTAHEHYAFLSDIADDFPGTDEDFTPAELDRIRGTVGTIAAPDDSLDRWLVGRTPNPDEIDRGYHPDFIMISNGSIPRNFPADYDPVGEDEGWITADESREGFDGFDDFIAEISA